MCYLYGIAKARKPRTHMFKTLQISELGHPILRAQTLDVKDIACTKFQDLIDDMIYTVKNVNGVGIAAPQVYENLKLFIMASKPSKRYPNAPFMDAIAIINPEIIMYSEEKIKAWEGCLSIPGIRGNVPRHRAITVKYTTRSGQQTTKSFTDFIARIFQHEYDHLNGLVFLDRLESNTDIITEKEYQNIVKAL